MVSSLLSFFPDFVSIMPNDTEESLYGHIREYELESLIDIEFSRRDAEAGVFPPDWKDLARLHSTVLQRKVTTILEFGVGFSTLIFAHALSINHQLYGEIPASKFRRSNAYQVHSVDTSEAYIAQAAQRIPDDLLNFVFFHRSDATMSTWGGKICSLYDTLPQIFPDFVYLDGPDPNAVKGTLHNVTTAHADGLPMSADLLQIEYFLLPGTLILVDGRTANTRFLKNNFQNKWAHQHDIEGDVHYLECVDPPLGSLNKKFLDWVNQPSP